MKKADVSATLADFLRPSHALLRLWRAVWESRKARRFLFPGTPILHAPATPIGVGERDSDR